MNERERMRETLMFGQPDKVPLQPGSPRESTLAAWHQQGLPEGANWWTHLLEILGLPSQTRKCRVDLGVSFIMIPTFEERVLDHRDGHYIVQDWMGAITEISDAYDYTSGWSTCLSAQEGHNDGLYCNPRVDELLEEAERLPLLDKERIAKYREIQDIIINQDVAWVALANDIAVRLSKPYVHDDYPSSIFGGWPFVEELWMEEP